MVTVVAEKRIVEDIFGGDLGMVLGEDGCEIEMSWGVVVERCP